MSETLYVILKSGNIIPISGVTALALDNTLTIKPGDFYRDEYVRQDDVNSSTATRDGKVFTNQFGDAVLEVALHTESWTCSYWKFTRGASLPILRQRWVDVEAICNEYPNRVAPSTATGVLYIPLRSGTVAVISGMAASTTAVIQNTSMTVYPGDFYRDGYVKQTDVNSLGVTSTDMIFTKQFGDAVDGDPLKSESWDASHMEFTRTGLLSLYIPERNVFGGPATSYPNRVAA